MLCLKLRERGRRTRVSRLVLLFSALSASSWKIVEERFMKPRAGGWLHRVYGSAKREKERREALENEMPGGVGVATAYKRR